MIGETATARPADRFANAGHGQDRRDAEVRVRGAEDDARESLRPSASRSAALGRAGSAPRYSRPLHARLAPVAYEVVLELERAAVGVHDRAHRIVRHRHDGVAHPEPRAEIARDRRQRLAGAQAAAYARRWSPGRDRRAGTRSGPPRRSSATMNDPRLVGPPPAGLRVRDAGERVHHRVEIRRHVEAEMLEVVAGVDGDDELLGRQHARESRRELRAADAARERNDHRKRSWSRGRWSSRAPPSRRASVTPRISTTGRPSSACPMTADAAAASSSAKPTSVICSARP